LEILVPSSVAFDLCRCYYSVRRSTFLGSPPLFTRLKAKGQKSADVKLDLSVRRFDGDWIEVLQDDMLGMQRRELLFQAYQQQSARLLLGPALKKVKDRSCPTKLAKYYF
jgi:hypothetical protein